MAPDRIHSNDPRAGQAMAELMVGLVGILLIVAGLLQVARLSNVSFDSYNTVRAGLAEQMIETDEEYSGDYLFAVSADPAGDEKIYTADDFVVEGDDGWYTDGRGFLFTVMYDDLEWYLLEYERENPYYLLSDSGFAVLAESFSMFYAVDRREVDMVPFLRTVFGRDQIMLEQEGWMPGWDRLLP